MNKSSKKRKASKNILSEEEVEELCERLESKRHDIDCEIARKLESSPNLAFYLSRAALKEAILGDINVLNEITARFPYRSLLHYAYSFCSKRTIEVTMDGLWGLLALFY